MKFVALALAVFLAVGSHAASLQADAPSQQSHVQSVIDLSLNTAKESLQKALNTLNDPNDHNLKNKASEYIETVFTKLNEGVAVISPVAETIYEASTNLHNTVQEKIDNLKTELEPKNSALKEVIQNHFHQYKAIFSPTIIKYKDKYNTEMENLKTELENIMQQMSPIVDSNIDETKTALHPIVETVSTKLLEQLTELQSKASPYVKEYEERLRSINIDSMMTKIHPFTDNIKQNIVSIVKSVTQ